MMIITICGSMKVVRQMQEVSRQLEAQGHDVRLPVEADGVDYWALDGSARVAAKRRLDLIRRHARHIDASDAILVVNITRNGIHNYIGGNTFLEIGHAHISGKPIYLLNPIPDQPYIADELAAIEPIVLNGNLLKIGIAPHHVG